MNHRIGRGPRMGSVELNSCRCSILDAREERLLDDEGIQVRLVCNRCGEILDSQILVDRRRKRADSPAEKAAEA